MTWLLLLWLLGELNSRPPRGGGNTGPFPPGDRPDFPKPVPVPTSGKTHVIRSGDTPSAVAKLYTGDGGRWRELLPENPALRVRQVRESPPVAAARPGLEDAGDSGRGVARQRPSSRVSGPGGRIVATYVEPFNPGQVLRLPSTWTSAG